MHIMHKIYNFNNLIILYLNNFLLKLKQNYQEFEELCAWKLDVNF
jgi:hypothetical protein